MGSADHTTGAPPQQKARDLARSARSTAAEAGDSVRRTAGQVGQSVQEAPEQVTRRTQGNPLAAGIIAFGAGMLAATLLPVSDAEERAGSQLREHSGELLGPARQTAQDLKEGMRGPATEALESVKSTAREAAEATRQQAQDSGQEAATGLRQVGQDAARQARDQAGRRQG